MTKAVTGVAEVNGAEIWYQLWGKGNPLICLHGGMGVDSSYLKVPGIIQLANKGRQVLIFDQRGHGRSGKIESQILFTFFLGRGPPRVSGRPRHR